MKLRIDNIEIKCTPREAAELIAEFKTNRVNVPYERHTPPYVITVSGTLDQNKIAERCKTVWRTV